MTDLLARQLDEAIDELLASTAEAQGNDSAAAMRRTALHPGAAGSEMPGLLTVAARLRDDAQAIPCSERHAELRRHALEAAAAEPRAVRRRAPLRERWKRGLAFGLAALLFVLPAAAIAKPESRLGKSVRAVAERIAGLRGGSVTIPAGTRSDDRITDAPADDGSDPRANGRSLDRHTADGLSQRAAQLAAHKQRKVRTTTSTTSDDDDRDDDRDDELDDDRDDARDDDDIRPPKPAKPTKSGSSGGSRDDDDRVRVDDDTDVNEPDEPDEPEKPDEADVDDRDDD